MAVSDQAPPLSFSAKIERHRHAWTAIGTAQAAGETAAKRAGRAMLAEEIMCAAANAEYEAAVDGLFAEPPLTTPDLRCLLDYLARCSEGVAEELDIRGIAEFLLRSPALAN